MTEAVSTSEALVCFYEITRRKITEDSHLQGKFFLHVSLRCDMRIGLEADSLLSNG